MGDKSEGFIGFFKWFDPRGRDVGTWAFILNRISALGLTIYLFLHLVVLGQLAKGAEAYDSFLQLIKSPWFIAGELLVILAGVYHGLNGLRIALTSFGIGVSRQARMFWFSLVITALIGLYFAYVMIFA